MSASLTASLNKARKLHAAGRLREAETVFSQLLKEAGQNAESIAVLAEAAFEMGEADAALSLYRKAAALAPTHARVIGGFGILLARLGRNGEAISHLRQAASLNPTDAKLHYNLGRALSAEKMTEQAMLSYRQACLLDPGFAWAFVNLGNALADLGQHDLAADAYRRALELDPGDAGTWSNYLLSSQYAEGVTAAKLFQLSRGFEENVGRKLRKYVKPHANQPDPDRRLRIGYVSADLKRHPVGYFMQGVFANHDPAQFEIHVYSCNSQEDDLTAELKRHAKAWVQAAALDDKALAQRIRADKIDILIDLAGHTGNNRLTVFAMKPAPLQATWAGYVGTTGLAAMDCIIADRFHIRPEEEAYYVEKVVRLPNSWLCFTPPDDALSAASTLRAARNDHVTFGCFNNPAKISQGTVRLWQRILDEVPGSRLTLRAAFFQSQERMDLYRNRFQEYGADVSRLDLLPALPQAELLTAYGDIDIALDPLPYSGGITTLEALWMGVPVVTRTGRTFPSRHSTSFLTTAGLDELVATDDDGYRAKAVALALDEGKRTALRFGLRAALAASPLLDHKRFTTDLELLLRRIWRERGSSA